MSDVRFIPGPGGTLIAPKRGKPPLPPDGYIATKGDPFVFEPILKPCPKRESRKRYENGCIPCGQSNPNQLFCTIEEKYVIPQICKKCPYGYN